MGISRSIGHFRDSAASRIALALAVSVLAVACGSGGGSSNGGGTTSANIAEAQSLVTKAEAPISDWKPAGGSFDATKAKGKSIWYISLSLSIPFEQFVLQGISKVQLWSAPRASASTATSRRRPHHEES